MKYSGYRLIRIALLQVNGILLLRLSFGNDARITTSAKSQVKDAWRGGDT
jgi:hypothetical protein